jgi:TatD DNase family protein
VILTDSHAHLTSVAEELGREALASLLGDYAAAAAEAALLGRAAPLLLDPGTEPDDLRDRLSLLRAALALGEGESLPPFLRLAAGIWPSPDSLADPSSSLARLERSVEAASSSGFAVAAIGEGGLDYHYEDGIKGGLLGSQAELFEGQLALASHLGLPMIVHSRDAAADTLSALRSAPRGLRVVIHCFGYGPSEAKAFLDLGCWISFAGNLTYKKSDALREACALVPSERLLLETDSPYMNPMPQRGKSSSPRDVERTYICAAALRGEGIEDLAETVSRNARELFG